MLKAKNTLTLNVTDGNLSVQNLVPVILDQVGSGSRPYPQNPPAGSGSRYGFGEPLTEIC